MQENKELFDDAYSLKEPIILYSISGVVLIAWIVLVIITGFYLGYLLILIVPAFFIISGILTHKKILGYRRQRLEQNKNNNPLE